MKKPLWHFQSSSSDGHRAAHGWVDRLVQDAAHVATLGELDVAVVTPRCTPRVLHEPVVLGSVVADSKHTVVEVGAAAGRQDTTSVVLEGSLVGLDGNGHWANVDGGLEGGHSGLAEQAANALVAGHSTLRDTSG